MGSPEWQRRVGEGREARLARVATVLIVLIRCTLVTLAGRRTYRLSERAVKHNARFDRRVTWLDAETFVPMKTEHHRGGELVLVAETTRVETIGGVVTPMSMSFRRIDTLREVELTVDKVDYTTPIPDEYFSVMALVRARGD